MDAFERLFDVRGIKSNQWILTDLGAMHCLTLNLVGGTFPVFLRVANDWW
jgi:hypothetical protein